MKKDMLSSRLKPIYDLELSLGNLVDQTIHPGQAVWPLSIIFREPLHREQIESTLKVLPPVKWYSMGSFEGYVCEESGQSLQGPIPGIAEVARKARKKLSHALQSIFDLEVALGNTVIRVDEPAGSTCPLAINFKQPLHKSRIESTLSLSPGVVWSENHDPHYAIEGGYKCQKTGHVLAGPL